MGDTIRESIEIIMGSGLPYEFRTTCARTFVDETAIGGIIDAIRGARRYVLQHCNPSSMLDAGYFGGDPPGLTEPEMAALRTIAAAGVDACIVR
jgi:hypothetical protein